MAKRKSEPQITRKVAINSLNALRMYFERSDDIQPDVFNSLHSLEQLLDRACVMNQTKITDFVARSTVVQYTEFICT